MIKFLDSPTPDLIISSPYKRAKETAEPICEYFGMQCKVWTDVREFTYLGSLHGIHSTIEERASKARAFWKQSDPYLRDGDEGETFAEFVQRTRKVLYQLSQREEQFI